MSEMSIRALAEGIANVESDLSRLNDDLEPLKVAAALKSEIMKYDLRLKTKPDSISPLDRTVIAALMRAMPQSPIGNSQDGMFHFCPTCTELHGISYDYLVGEDETGEVNYCRRCGQAIDWSRYGREGSYYTDGEE